jgi:hypothetical protein
MKSIFGFLFSLVLIFILLVSALVMIGCSNADVTLALEDAATGAQTLAKAQPKLQKWADGLSKLSVDYPKATTPDAQLALLPTLTAATDLFQSDVLPLLDLKDPNITLGVLAVQVALKIVANHFIKQAALVGNSSAGKVAIKVMATSNRKDSPAAQVERLKAFVKTPKVKQ